MAEISDKEPTAVVFVLIAGFCAGTALLMVRFRWAMLIALPLAIMFAAFCAAYIFGEIGHPEIGAAIIRERGYAHVALVALCGIVPIAVALPLFFRHGGMPRTAWITTGISLFVSPVLCFGGANALDFLRYRAAINRATGLSPTQIAALAGRCASIGKPEQFEQGGWPPEFAPLHPHRVSVGPGLSNASLYELGDIYFEFRIETTPQNQRIYFFTNSSGTQQTTRVWERDPELMRRANPTGRIVTLYGYGAHYGEEWIVLPDRILVKKHFNTSGSEDSVVSVPLDTDSAATIKRLAADLRRQLGGRMYDGRAIDGLGMAVLFSSSGALAADDVVAQNAWADELSPLVDAISKVAVAAPPAELRRQIISMREGAPPGSPGPKVRNVTKARAQFEGRPRLPWWCVWRKLSSSWSASVDVSADSTATNVVK